MEENLKQTLYTYIFIHMYMYITESFCYKPETNKIFKSIILQ